VKLISLRCAADPEPMTEQDLADWGGAVDSRSSVSLSGRVTPERVIRAGEAVVSVINARRGKP
jgi:hypothetical protein